jgi:hypothetical protein
MKMKIMIIIFIVKTWENMVPKKIKSPSPIIIWRTLYFFKKMIKFHCDNNVTLTHFLFHQE